MEVKASIEHLAGHRAVLWSGPPHAATPGSTLPASDLASGRAEVHAYPEHMLLAQLPLILSGMCSPGYQPTPTHLYSKCYPSDEIFPESASKTRTLLYQSFLHSLEEDIVLICLP